MGFLCVFLDFYEVSSLESSIVFKCARDSETKKSKNCCFP